VALGGVALALLIAAVVATLYVRFIRYERVAARHVPPGSVLAVRLDVEQAQIYEPVREHLLPLFGGPSRPLEEGDARLARIEARSGLRRGDLREIVFARGRSREDWVFVFGGIFPRGMEVRELAAALGAEDPAWGLSSGGRTVVHGIRGTTVGRGMDGSVLLASSAQVAESAVTPTSTYEALALPRTGPGAFALGRDALRELSQFPAIAAAGDLPELLGALVGATARLTLGERLTLTLAAVDSGGGQGARTIEGILALARGLPSSDASPAGRLFRAGVDRSPQAQPAPRPSSASAPGATREASLDLIWEREEVGQAFSLVSEAIQSGFRQGSAALPVLTRPEP
jgi:hypothetical protein